MNLRDNLGFKSDKQMFVTLLSESVLIKLKTILMEENRFLVVKTGDPSPKSQGFKILL